MLRTHFPNRGEVVWEHGKMHTKKGSGKFIPRNCFGFAFEGLAEREKARDERKLKVDREPYSGEVWSPGKSIL